MLDHIGFSVTDYARAKAFYKEALAPLGVSCIMEVPEGVTEHGDAFAGFGRDRPQFWISGGPRQTPGLHIAIMAADRAMVDAFYIAALNAGGRDNGPPGLRPQYHPNYYGAFVLDPDGHNIEAVCHDPVQS